MDLVVCLGGLLGYMINPALWLIYFICHKAFKGKILLILGVTCITNSVLDALLKQVFKANTQTIYYYILVFISGLLFAAIVEGILYVIKKE